MIILVLKANDGMEGRMMVDELTQVNDPRTRPRRRGRRSRGALQRPPDFCSESVAADRFGCPPPVRNFGPADNGVSATVPGTVRVPGHVRVVAASAAERGNCCGRGLHVSGAAEASL